MKATDAYNYFIVCEVADTFAAKPMATKKPAQHKRQHIDRHGVANHLPKLPLGNAHLGRCVNEVLRQALQAEHFMGREQAARRCDVVPAAPCPGPRQAWHLTNNCTTFG